MEYRVWKTKEFHGWVVAPGEMCPQDQGSSYLVRFIGHLPILRQETKERRAEPSYLHHGAGELSRGGDEGLRKGTDAKAVGYR